MRDLRRLGREVDVRQDVSGAPWTTFIIDGDGTVAHVIPKASPKTHDDEVLRVLGEMAAAAGHEAS